MTPLPPLPSVENVKIRENSEKRVAERPIFTFFGPLACLAAALGPLALLT